MTVFPFIKVVERSFDGCFFDLQKTKKENSAILAAVDKLSKRAHFTQINSAKLTAKEVSESVYREIFKNLGFPKDFFSDDDLRFTSYFWTDLMKWLQVQLSLLAAFCIDLWPV